MATWKKTTLLLICCAGLLLAAMPQDCHATFFRNWIKRRSAESTAYRPTYCSAYGPQTANYPGQCGTTCMSSVRTCPQTVVRYVPQTCYRTVWSSVPITYYRPVTTTDPYSGCQTTCMRPCTTNQWQARRVPYTTYRPVCSQIQVTTPVTTPYYGNYGTVFRGFGTQGFATPGCSPCGQGQALPYSSVQAPATVTQPLAPTAGPFTQPYSPTPAIPADQQPSLDPNSGPAGMRTQPLQPTTRLLRPSTPSPASTTPSNGLTPVPDLDRQERMRRENGAPRLLNPNDQTAARPIRHAGAVAPIQWSQPIDSQDDDKGEWDDSGWTSAAQ